MRMSWFAVVSLLLSIALIGCGGYVKKDEFEKQLSDQKMDIEQKVQLAQDSAATANDKAEKALTASRQIDKIKEDILLTVDGKIDSAMVAAKSDPQEIKRIAEDAANKVLDEAKSEDEKVKMLAKEAADKAMNAAMEADRRAQEAARQAELAKELPGVGEYTKFAVYFDAGKAVVKSEGISELEKVAGMIKDNPNITLRIEGHSDNSPIVRSKFRSNWLLSQARAQAVRDYLVDKLGVPADSIKQVVGFAEFKPSAPNDKNRKWENRRVEVIIVK